MQPSQRFSTYESLPAAVAGFSALARASGLLVGVGETKEALMAASLGLAVPSHAFRYALKSIFANSPEEGELFDDIFDHFWLEETRTARGKTTFFNQAPPKPNPRGSVVLMGNGKREGEEEDMLHTSGANAVERLIKTDFSKVREVDHAWLEELAWKLWQQMSLRLKRRQKRSQKKERLDLRHTIRKSLAYGGQPLHLQYKSRDQRKQKLVILLDVSGSMDKYSFFLLRFICALKSHFKEIEAFLFSTRLICISDMLEPHLLDTTLHLLSQEANHWSGGTRIGECFREFNQTYAKQILHGKSTVIILSDGLETGDADALAEEAAHIQLRTRQLIWLNPLKGMAGYEPIAKGMKAALPSIDVFRSAHNLQSILELENYLIHV